MPYTKSEIEKLDFYTEFRDGLRYEYLNRMSASAENNFRDENNVLYSYEDIITTLGSETIRVSADGIYKNYVSQQEIDNSKSVNNLSYPVYNPILPKDKAIDKSNLVNKLIDRSITELSQDVVSDKLPNGISNGNVLTNEDPTSQDRWLVEDNQKREFRNIGEFYGLGKTFSQLKSLSEDKLNSIPDGEPIE
tara:strand:- start:440 stop:1015 length:576 start_codon:yes stop_codon:yes gene_type:complete